MDNTYKAPLRLQIKVSLQQLILRSKKIEDKKERKVVVKSANEAAFLLEELLLTVEGAADRLHRGKIA